MCEQNASYLAKHWELESKNLNTIYLKVIQKARKRALQHVNFQKFFGGACPRIPLQLFLLLNQFQISSAEKNTFEKMWKLRPPSPLLKFLATPLPVLIVGEENLVISFGPTPL